jgi:hypothetical protein
VHTDQMPILSPNSLTKKEEEEKKKTFVYVSRATAAISRNLDTSIGIGSTVLSAAERTILLNQSSEQFLDPVFTNLLRECPLIQEVHVDLNLIKSMT